MINKDPFYKAREYAFLLLKFRLRSEREISDRLKKKNFAENVIKETVSFLKDKGFIDDRAFAKAWIESRIKKPLGLIRIKGELKLKGIDKEIIESLITDTKQDYREQDLVKRIARERFKKLEGIEVSQCKRRVYGYLIRRGFSPEIVIDTLNQLCK